MHTHAYIHMHTHLGHETFQGRNIAPNICSRAYTDTRTHCTLAEQWKDSQIVHSVMVSVLCVQESGVEGKQGRRLRQSPQHNPCSVLLAALCDSNTMSQLTATFSVGDHDKETFSSVLLRKHLHKCFILCQNNCSTQLRYVLIII